MDMEAICQCGQLSAQVADGADVFTVLCHCTDCQRRSGSPFGVIGYFPKEAVTITGEAGEFSRSTYVGNTLTNGFCRSCGSTITVHLSKNEALIGIPVGAFTNPDFPPPVRAVWDQCRHPWISLPEGLATFNRGTDNT
jgi:hypothetical protein